MTQQQEMLLRETHDNTVQLRAVVCGMDGRGGLVDTVSDHEHKIESLNEFKAKWAAVAAAIVGVGSLAFHFLIAWFSDKK